jgi:hypothetical protein
MKLDVSKNTFTKEDSANQTDYNPKDLIKLEEL